ncbi:PD-(D/E)XK nuclease family protein [Saccharolobus solfataricus]|nr:PD-(D/E)XK nuclease family protein [Saccharolobus solfataricus]QPG51227.1 PD-(D/E)XK nuclease family protein [Saccharolobus solfataricus]
MSLAEEIKKVLKENPSIIVDALAQRPEILYDVLVKLMPWQVIIRDIDDLKNHTQKIEKELGEVKESLKNFVTKEDAKNFATKDDIKRLETIITGLGARWGLLSEDAFRQGVYEIMKSEGIVAKKELVYDKTGEVYGEPSDVEYDLMIEDGNLVMIEITSAIKRGDLPVIRKKKEFYERNKNVKISKVIVITPFLHDKYPDRLKAMAKDMGIEIINP